MKLSGIIAVLCLFVGLSYADFLHENDFKRADTFSDVDHWERVKHKPVKKRKPSGNATDSDKVITN